MQDIVDVRGYHEALDGQPHLRCDIAGKNVPEVPRRHAEGNFSVGSPKLQRCRKVIDDLRHQPRPIDRIDGADAVRAGDFLIGEQPLHHGLRIVEAGVLECDIVHIGRSHRRHLHSLYVADTAGGVEHEDFHPITPGDRVDRGRTRVAAGRTHDREPAVLARKEFFEQQPEQLQGDILEGERRAVEQFEQPVAFVQLRQGRYSGVSEATIGLLAQLAQTLLCQAFAYERCHDLRREFGIRQTAKSRDFFCRKARPFLRHIQAAVAREPRKGDFCEI